jgi:hypothetical protein
LLLVDRYHEYVPFPPRFAPLLDDLVNRDMLYIQLFMDRINLGLSRNFFDYLANHDLANLVSFLVD